MLCTKESQAAEICPERNMAATDLFTCEKRELAEKVNTCVDVLTCVKGPTDDHSST